MKKNDFTSAYNYACLLLKYRDRTESELVHRLKNKFFSDEIIKKVVDKLKESKFLNDEKFVNAYIEKNLTKGKSLKLIQYELKIKHNILVDEKKLNFYKNDSLKKIIDIVKKRFGKKISDLNTTNKLRNFLLRKGYDYNEIKDIIQKTVGKTDNNYFIGEENE